MSEINNNIPSFGINSKKVEKRYNNENADKQPQVKSECCEHKYVPDTGVLGRSQVKVKCPKCGGADIAASVDETVKLAQKNPEILEASDVIFDEVYEAFLADGCTKEEAYAQATLAVEEFCLTALAR